MPLDRLIHPRLGRSKKVNALTDLEYRVWTQYLLSADDFGVMCCDVSTVQAGSKSLATRTASAIRRSLERLISVRLVLQFVHQEDQYLCQHDWQDFQKITFPRQTNNPKPPDETIAQCSVLTRTLLDLHPGGKKKKSENPPETSPELSKNTPGAFLNNSENVPGIVSYPTRAQPRETATATATANGQRQTATADGERLTAHGGPLIQRGVVLRQGASPGRPPVPHEQHEKFLGRLAPPLSDEEAQAELDAFYARVRMEWADRPILPASDWKFWDARFDEWKPAPAAKKRGEKDFDSAIAAFVAKGAKS